MKFRQGLPDAFCWRERWRSQQPPTAKAAGPLKEIRIDWATYNPVSMVLKQKGLLEKVILVAHDVDEAVVLLDRVLVMRPAV